MFYANYVRRMVKTLPRFDTKEGNTVLIEDGIKKPFRKISILGESTQDGVPTPDAPIEILSVENPAIRVTGSNLFNIDVITNVGTLINNGDGTITVTGVSNTTGKSLGDVCPSVRVGDRIAFYMETTGSNKLIYLHTGSGYINFGTYFTVTEADLSSRLFFLGNSTAAGGGSATISNIRVAYEGCSTDYTPYIEPQEVVLNGIILRGLQNSDGAECNDEVIVDGKRKTVKVIQRVHYWNSLEKPVRYAIFSKNEEANIIKFYNTQIASKNWYLGKSYCTHFRYQYGVGGDNPFVFSHGDSSESVYFKVPLDEYPTPADFKAFMDTNRVEIICKLNEPVETDLTDTEIGEALLGLYTNRGITRISIDSKSKRGSLKVRYVRK